jgi:flagellin-like protein
MKGISPIIASVLLIAITMSIAVILAAYVTNYTRTATESIPSSCIGGALFVSGTPTCIGGVTGTITISVEANYVTLNGFKADTRDSDGNILETAISQTSGTTSLAPSEAALLKFGTADCTDVAEVRVTTTNCFNVRSDWTAV